MRWILVVLLCCWIGFGKAKEKEKEPVVSNKDERTLIIIKPDGVHRGVIGSIMHRFERRGFKLVAIKMFVPAPSLVEEHYRPDHSMNPFYGEIIKYISSGPVVPMVWEGQNVIKTIRKMMGSTTPVNASPGTIRGDFGIHPGRNLIHGSDCLEAAQREIPMWFTEQELVNWEPIATPWIYEPELDGRPTDAERDKEEL